MTAPWGSRPDRGSPPHERASTLLLERLDGPLESDDAAWLDAHLASCHACFALEEAFAADRAELRSLRRQPIEPPRDLWARTAAALEQEARSGRSRRSQRRRPAPAPMGAAAGLLVVAVVIGASMLSGGPSVTPVPSAAVGSPTPTLFAVSIPPSVAPTSTALPSVEPTRLAVPSGDVPYIAEDDDGNNALFNIGVTEVCSTSGGDCAPLNPSSPRVLDLPNSPRAVIQSPDEEQLIVVDAGAKGDGGTITLVPIPAPAGSGEPPSTDAPETQPPTATPTPTPTPTRTPTPPVTPTPTPPVAPTPTTPVTASPTESSPSTAPPTASIEPTATVEPTATQTGTLSPTPSATATATAIAENVVVDGASAAFSPDGRFLAFSARPADGSHGPDIYLWVTDGTEAAAPITTDHRSVFAGWLGDTILGSRIVDETDGADPLASASFGPDAVLRKYGRAFVVDPDTGTITTVSDQPLWRPSVDPTGSRVVYWDGELDVDVTGDPRTEIGRLVLGPWTAAVTGTASPDASGDPEPTSPLPSVTGADPSPDGGIDVLAEGPLVDWDARWDETGTHLAVWIADPDDPTIGKLSLYIVDPETGRLNADLAPLTDARALPGFAIGQGRLVWATPPGQDAEASHVSVLAWTADGIGKVESRPADEIVVIR